MLDRMSDSVNTDVVSEGGVQKPTCQCSLLYVGYNCKLGLLLSRESQERLEVFINHLKPTKIRTPMVQMVFVD